MLASLPQSYDKKSVDFSPNTETHFITEISQNDKWKKANLSYDFLKKPYVKEISTFLYVECWDLTGLFTFNCDGNSLKNNNLRKTNV